MFGLRIGKPSFLSNEPMYFDTPENPQLSGTPLLSTPTSIDWRELGIVTPVKNQGSCGSCWAFAAVAFLESEFIKRNKVANTLNLAEHFLMQCDTKSANCDGGNPFSAAALGVAKGMPNEASMPYKIGYDYSSSYCSSPKIRSRFKQSGSITSTYSSTNNTRDTGIINFLQYRPVILGLEAS
jgi:C1A family cysteine protease